MGPTPFRRLFCWFIAAVGLSALVEFVVCADDAPSGSARAAPAASAAPRSETHGGAMDSMASNPVFAGGLSFAIVGSMVGTVVWAYKQVYSYVMNRFMVTSELGVMELGRRRASPGTVLTLIMVGRQDSGADC